MPLPIPPNPILKDQAPSFVKRWADVRTSLKAMGKRIHDLGSEDIHETTWVGVREALKGGVRTTSPYPDVEGLRKLREATTGYLQRRFDVDLDPETQTLPVRGVKEGIFHFPFLFLHPSLEKRIVLFGEPGYPIYKLGTLYAGGEAHGVPLSAKEDYLLRLEEVPSEVLEKTALLWINYPHNPTGATAPLKYYEEIVQAAKEYGFIVCSDETYSEVYSDKKPPSILQVTTDNVVAFHSLSHHSGMAGYRAGFVAGDSEIMQWYRKFRPVPGLRQPVFIQEATIAALDNDQHVEKYREQVRQKRALFLAFFDKHQIPVAASVDTPYLWVACPTGMSSEAYALELLNAGILVSPGTYFGEAGDGFVRISLCLSLEECQAAIDAWDKFLN